MVTKVKLSEAQIRRIVYEELVEHYLIQKHLWSDEDQEKKPRQVNKGGKTA